MHNAKQNRTTIRKIVISVDSILGILLFIFFPQLQNIINFQMEQPSREDALSRSQATQQAQQRIIFNLLQKVGAEGRYQKISLIVWCICGYLTGCILLNAPFILYQDSYVCPAQITQSCEAYVCSLLPSQRTPFIPQSSLHSLINEYGDYRCSPQKNNVSLIVLIMYVGVMSGELMLSLLGDVCGRKTLSISGLVTLIGGCFIVIFSNNLIMAVCGLFLMMFGVQLSYSISFLFICETVSEELREHYQVWVHIMFGVGQTANVGLYFWLGDWKPVVSYFYLLPAAIGLLTVVLFVVDTPISLVKNYETEDAMDRFLWIAKVNGVQNCQITPEDINVVKEIQNIREINQTQSNTSKFTLLDLFKYTSLRYMTMFLAIMRVAVEFLYYVPNFMIAQFQLSIYINGLSLGLSSLLGFIISSCIISSVKRKSYGIFSFSVVFVCTLVLIYFWKPKGDGQTLPLSTNIGILVAIIIINLLISIEFSFFQVYTTQLYPSQVRVIAFGFITVMGGTGVAVSDFIVNACIDNGVSVMIVFAILAFLSIISSLILPQTLKVPPPDIIEELTTVRAITEKKIQKRNSLNSDQDSRAEMDVSHVNIKKTQSKVEFDTTVKKQLQQHMDLDDVVKRSEAQSQDYPEVKKPAITQSADLENVGKSNRIIKTVNLDCLLRKVSTESLKVNHPLLKIDSAQTADMEYPFPKKVSQQISDINHVSENSSQQNEDSDQQNQSSNVEQSKTEKSYPEPSMFQSKMRQEQNEQSNVESSNIYSYNNSEENNTEDMEIDNAIIAFQQRRDFNNLTKNILKSEKKLE